MNDRHNGITVLPRSFLQSCRSIGNLVSVNGTEVRLQVGRRDKIGTVYKLSSGQPVPETVLSIC